MTKGKTKTLITGILAFLVCAGAFANVTFLDGSTSKTFPTTTLYKHKWWGKWTMDTYARISITSNDIIKIDGRTKLRSSRLQGFTGGVFIDLKDKNGNVIDRISAKTNQSANENQNGKYVGWGVNGKKTRYVNWEATVPTNIQYLVKTVSIFEVHTPKKIDWGKAKDTFRKIAANLKKAVKNFFENGGAQLIVKYGPDFVRMSNEAKEGTLSASEVLSVMNQVVVDAKEYGIITSTKATSIIEIVSSVNDIISTGKNAWNNPQVQETTIALMQNVVAITDGSVSDSTLLVMLNQLETILNAGGNYSTEILNSLESIAINTQNLLEGKLNESQYNSLESLISIIKQINETQSSSNLKVKVQCAFDFTRMVIEMHNDAVSGSLTASTAQTKLVNFLDTYYSVLGLNESQNNAAGEITNSLAIIINNNTEGLLPANQEKLVNLVVDIKEIASSKTVNYSLINKFVNDVEGICESKSAFVSSSFPQFVNIVENVYTLIAPKLNAGSNADVIINKTITLLNTIESLGNEPVANNLSVFFNGVRFVLDIAQSVQEKTITAANAQKQFNTYWTNDLYPTLINACPDKVAQINKIKSTLDTIFKYIVLVQN